MIEFTYENQDNRYPRERVEWEGTFGLKCLRPEGGSEDPPF